MANYTRYISLKLYGLRTLHRHTISPFWLKHKLWMVEWHCCQKGKYYEQQMNWEKLELDQRNTNSGRNASHYEIVRKRKQIFYQNAIVKHARILFLDWSVSLKFIIQKTSIFERGANFRLYFSSSTSIINEGDSAGRICGNKQTSRMLHPEDSTFLLTGLRAIFLRFGRNSQKKTP